MPKIFIFGEAIKDIPGQLEKLFESKLYYKHLKVIPLGPFDFEPFFLLAHGSCGKDLNDIEKTLHNSFPNMQIRLVEVKLLSKKSK